MSRNLNTKIETTANRSKRMFTLKVSHTHCRRLAARVQTLVRWSTNGERCPVGLSAKKEQKTNAYD